MRLIALRCAGYDRVDVAAADAAGIAVARVPAYSPTSVAEHALAMMHEGRFRHLPVTENGRPVGMISVRDALGSELEAFVYELLRQEQVSQILA